MSESLAAKERAFRAFWKLLTDTFELGTVTEDRLQKFYRVVWDRFRRVDLSQKNLDDLFDELLLKHRFFPWPVELLDAWEIVKPYRTSSEQPVDPSSLPENERPL